MEIKCQLDATEVFIADLIACSTCFGHHYAHHQELKIIIQWLLRVVFCAVIFSSSWSGVELRVVCPVCRMLQHPANRNHIRIVTTFQNFADLGSLEYRTLCAVRSVVCCLNGQGGNELS